MTCLALILAISAIAAVLYAVYLRSQNTALAARVHEAEGVARQAGLKAGHAEDVAKAGAASIPENVATMGETGTFTSPPLFGRKTPPVALALILSLLATPPASAADHLGIGTAITSTSGETVILTDERLLIDRAEVANVAVMVADLRRCQAALAECDSTPKPIPTAPAKSRLGWWVAAFLGAFVAGYAANEYVTAEEPPR